MLSKSCDSCLHKNNFAKSYDFVGWCKTPLRHTHISESQTLELLRSCSLVFSQSERMCCSCCFRILPQILINYRLFFVYVAACDSISSRRTYNNVIGFWNFLGIDVIKRLQKSLSYQFLGVLLEILTCSTQCTRATKLHLYFCLISA